MHSGYYVSLGKHWDLWNMVKTMQKISLVRMQHNNVTPTTPPLMPAYTSKIQNIWQQKVSAVEEVMGLILEVGVSVIISDSLLTI